MRITFRMFIEYKCAFRMFIEYKCASHRIEKYKLHIKENNHAY